MSKVLKKEWEIEFDKIAGLLVYAKDFNGKPETVWQTAKIKEFISFLLAKQEEIDKLDKEIEKI